MQPADILEYNCDLCGDPFSIEFDEGKRLEVEGELVSLCNKCIADEVVDCEHALVTAYDHFIWRKNAVDAGDGELVCHAELIARLEASEIVG